MINFFYAMVSFYTPRKHQKTSGFSNIFRRYGNTQVAWNEFKLRPKFCCVTNVAQKNLLKVNNTELIQGLKFVQRE